MSDINTKAIREIVNNLFQDVDTQGLIDTNTANAICEIYTKKLTALIAVVQKDTQEETIKEVEDWVKLWGAIPETDPYANGWNNCRKELRKGFDRVKARLSVNSSDGKSSDKVGATSEAKS